MSLPNTMYVEVLNETGGGNEVQFPVASLSGFFGLHPGDTRELRFEFPASGDVINRAMSHNDNNTHRVYFGPLRDVLRPSLLIIERAGQDDYRCTIADPIDVDRLIAAHCTEQTRRDSRRWGVQ